MHHIWLGDKKIPEPLVKCMRTCYEHHPTWKHMVWTEDNMPSPFVFKNEWNLDNNLARKSDLLRLQVLYNHGGVYLDTDMECIKPIDELLNGYRFVMCSECGNPFYEKNCEESHLNNAMIASTKNNLIVGNIMLEFKRRYRNVDIKEKEPLEYVAHLSGPDVFNHFRQKLDTLKQVKIYPSEYFYPIHYSNKKKMKYWNIPTNPLTLEENTYMIHHFAASWYKQK